MIKHGLVLGGGGSRGAYQIGVWKALNELNIKPDIITGTSIGALNGALMVQEDYEGALQLWNGMDYDKVVSDISPENFYTYKGTGQVFFTFLKSVISEGGIDITPLEETVREMLDEYKVRSSSTEFGMVTVEYPNMKEVAVSKKEIPHGKMADYLLASAACYPAFKCRNIDDTKYVDGGYRNNLPIDLAIELGANEVIAVDLEAAGEYVQSSYRNIPVRYIKSYWNLGAFLAFSKDVIKKNMKLGYLDVMRSYRVLDGTAYAFKKGEKEILYESAKPYYEFFKNMTGIDIEERDKIVDKTVTSKLIKAMNFNPKSKICTKEYLLRMAEITAQNLNISPVKIYTVEEFNTEILKVYSTKIEINYKTFEEKIKEPKNLSSLAEKIGDYEVREIIAFIYGMLKKSLESRSTFNIKVLATLVPKELLSALYIFFLKNRDTIDRYGELNF